MSTSVPAKTALPANPEHSELLALYKGHFPDDPGPSSADPQASAAAAKDAASDHYVDEGADTEPSDDPGEGAPSAAKRNKVFSWMSTIYLMLAGALLGGPLVGLLFMGFGFPKLMSKLPFIGKFFRGIADARDDQPRDPEGGRMYKAGYAFSRHGLSRASEIEAYNQAYSRGAPLGGMGQSQYRPGVPEDQASPFSPGSLPPPPRPRSDAASEVPPPPGDPAIDPATGAAIEPVSDTELDPDPLAVGAPDPSSEASSQAID